MGKGGKRQKKGTPNPKKQTRDEYFADEDMDDEVDAFHKQRDVIPLDVDGDVGLSDEDNEHPVFDFEMQEEEDDDEDDDHGGKIAKQQKYLRQKCGGVDDEMPEDEEKEEDKRAVWGRRKGDYYSADNVDYEIQSDEEGLPAEEAEVVRLQEDRAKNLSLADHGLEDFDEDKSGSDKEPTLEDILVKGKRSSKPHSDKETEEDMDTSYEEVKKDLSALSREEQMDVVYSSAPELVGLLSELNNAYDQLEGKVNPLLSKVKARGNTSKGGMHYLELKQLLLLSYCQAIGFYLLLKSEGHPVRDHPVIARLVEIKTLLDKMKQLDGNLPTEIEEILNLDQIRESAELPKQSDAVTSETHKMEDYKPSSVSAKTHERVRPYETAELVKVNLSKGYKTKEEKSKHKNDEVGKQSVEMLKIRAKLDEKLKEKGILSSIAPKPDQAQKHLVQRVNRQLESFDDFDDEVIDKEGAARGLRNGPSSKLSKLVSVQMNKPKVISGDDDLPKRDDLGERRRKHELRVLGKAGMDAMDDDEDHKGDSESDGVESEEDDFYNQVKQQRDAKLSAKAHLYSRTSAAPSLEEAEPGDGKRHITTLMEKNRGLTRARKKLIKNPRKKYRLKHQDKVMRRKGQVRDIKKPSGPYGGEVSGINAGISRSIRFKN